ncbi:conserved hypothetical protein [Ricinus communis]|uniref:Uncharacterized protein n=1 Tax=Ricinus communis TaxID=3988 RepID=B9RQ22_RICCO|nr:conserved hypothetical protein [Ricinus communis]
MNNVKIHDNISAHATDVVDQVNGFNVHESTIVDKQMDNAIISNDDVHVDQLHGENMPDGDISIDGELNNLVRPTFTSSHHNQVHNGTGYEQLEGILVSELVFNISSGYNSCKGNSPSQIKARLTSKAINEVSVRNSYDHILSSLKKAGRKRQECSSLTRLKKKVRKMEK